jgi:Ca2+-binding EF-hand superfamily protein
VRTPLLTTVLTVALSGTVLAVPDAPALAPAPRAAKPKFTAPKFKNAYEVLVFTTQRPVRMQIEVMNDGKSMNELWRARLKTLFDFCDRDGNGELSEKETKFAFSDTGMAQLLANGFYQPGTANNAKLSELDKDGDGTVSFDEFVASYPRTTAQVFRTQAAQPDFSNNAAVTEALFKLIDANQDGKLTKEEVKAVETYLASHDSDEDECLNQQELTPDLYDPRFGGRRPVQIVQPPNGTMPYDPRAVNGVVNVYEVGRIPGTITQQVIKRYDQDSDFELTQSESGFDDVTYKRLDKDGNGRLDGEELDVWRTGEPELEVSLSLAPKAVDCVAKINDEKSAEARGFKIKQVEGGRLMLHVGKQPIDLWAFAAVAQARRATLKQQYGYLFTQAAGGKQFVEEKNLNGPNAVQFQFVRVMFESAERDADGKMSKAEFDGYFDLQESFRDLSLTLTPGVQTPSLFQLLDENRDGRLGVRELRTAWTRLQSLEDPAAETVTKKIIQPAVTLRLSRSLERFFVNQPVQPGFNPNQVVIPRNGPLWFRKMDRNGDGDLSRTEYVGTKAEFDSLDTDRDDLISLQEAEAYDKKMRVADPDKPAEAKPDKTKPDRKKDQ